MIFRVVGLALFGIFLTGCQVKPVENSERVGDAGRALFRTLSVSDDPKGMLSGSQLKRFWITADKGRTCQSGADLNRDKPIQVNIYSVPVLTGLEWKSPFVKQLNEFNTPWVKKKPPSPIVSVSLNEAYGARQIAVDSARDWFLKTSLNALHPESSVEKRRILKDALLGWARENALSKGTRVSWGNKSVDWQLMTLIGALLNGTAVVAEDMSEEEKALVGPWMNRLMKDVGSSYWLSRQDNKAYMRAYYLALWSSLIGDVDLLASVSEQYKLAINDMRDDGSLPVDSSRSGMGLKYHSDSTRYLTAIAQLFNTNIGLGLHNYETSDARSLDTLVGFAILGMKNPLAVNQLHAKPCTDGGDRWGGVDSPSTGYISNMTFLQNYYLDLFPYSPYKSWLSISIAPPKIDEVLGFTANGLFRVHSE